MVGMNIHDLNIEELSGVVDIYPWYGGAHKELCLRMKKIGALDDGLLSSAALYLGSRRILFDLTHESESPCDEDLRLSAPAPVEESGSRKIFVVGSDYFTQDQYNGVKRSSDNIFSSFATRAREDGYKEPEAAGMGDFCTETLARIYLEQGYFAEAKTIYSKLSLRYPEKSVYFAALIAEIDKNI